MILGLFPKLETVYDGLMVLTSEQKEKVQQMKNLQFDVIQKKLNTVEEIIDKVNG